MCISPPLCLNLRNSAQLLCLDVKTHTKRSQAILILNILHVHFHATVLGKERTWKLCTAIRNVPSQIQIIAKHSGLVVFTISARKITFFSYFQWATYKTYVDDTVTHNST
jgi:hypothetical protein